MLIKFEKHFLPRRFYVTQRSSKHPKVDDRDKESYYIQLGVIFALLFFIIVAFTFQKPERIDEVPFVPTNIVLNVEDIPETRQSLRAPLPPKMPVVPVESEEIEEMLEDIVFELETLGLIDLPEMPKMGVGIGLPGISVSPRQTVEKWPYYPDSEKKKGHEGVIDLKIYVDEKGNVTKVEVIRNTTKSKVLEKIAIDVAMECKFQPARDRKNRPIAVWTTKTYTFSIK